MRTLLILAFLTIIPANISATENHEDDAKRMWASYYCSALARMSDDEPTQARLLQKGTALGRPLIEAVGRGEANAFTIGKSVPPFIMTQTNVSIDFQLGSLWMASERAAVDDVLKKVSKGFAEPMPFTSIAKEEFKIRNCDLL